MAVDGTTQPRRPSPRGLAAAAPTLRGPGSRPSPGADAPPGLPRGTSVGRYTIVERLGAGGMGVVYRARDPELDRDVAIKLLRPDASATDTVQRTGDLLREGRAAGQLAHPNVVRVFDVGTVGKELFIAMEYLRGQTLRHWLEAQQRDRREILDALVRAGAGLAAAHAAGLVHGDFKPRNVMVTDDDRVVVLDFGLGHLDGRPPARDPEQSAFAVSGTPPFMAPELFDGRAASPASDQFAFCVSLYQALCGEHPFGPGQTPQLHGTEAKAPPRTRVSGRVWRGLARGLSVDPEARFASMDELLAGIAPPARASRLLMGLTGGAAIGALVVAVSASDRPGCEEGAGLMREAWEAPRSRLDEQRQGPTYERLRQRLDGYAAQWARQWDEACHAHHVEATQSADLFHRRVRCLERSRAQLVALVDQLGRETTSASEAAEVASQLPPIAACEDTPALLAGPQVPEDPALRDEIAQLVAHIASEHTLGQFARERDGALTRLAEHLEHARELDSDFAVARAHLAQGATLTRAGRDEEGLAAYRQALHHAEAAGHDPLAADIASSLVHTAGVLDELERATLWAEYGRAKLARAGLERSALALSLMAAEGVALRRAGQTARSIEVLEGALTVHAQTGAAPAGVLGDLYGALGLAYRAEASLERARETTEQAVATRRELYGANHPLVGHSYYNLATIHLQMQDIEIASDVLDKARAILDQDPRAVKASLTVAALLGPVLAERGKLDAAHGVLADAVARARAVYPAESYELNPLLINYAKVQIKLGRAEDAVASAREGLAIGQAVRGKDYPPLRVDLGVLTEALLAAGQPQEALLHAEHALALTPATHPSRADIEQALHDVRAKLKAPALPPASPGPPASPDE